MSHRQASHRLPGSHHSDDGAHAPHRHRLSTEEPERPSTPCTAEEVATHPGSFSLYLLVPLQQHGAAVVRGPLEAPVDVLHQQVHAGAVQRSHCLLDVSALKAAQHPDHQQLRPLLHTHTHTL